MIVAIVVVLLVLLIISNLVIYIIAKCKSNDISDYFNRAKSLTTEDIDRLNTIKQNIPFGRSYAEDVEDQQPRNLSEIETYIKNTRPEPTTLDFVEQNHKIGRVSSSHLDCNSIEVEVLSKPKGTRYNHRSTELDGYIERS